MMRRKLLIFIRKILKVPDNEYSPDWIVKILFPIQFAALRGAPIRYNFERDTLTIFGIEYSCELFRQWSNIGLPIGTKFTIVNRINGVVDLQIEK